METPSATPDPIKQSLSHEKPSPKMNLLAPSSLPALAKRLNHELAGKTDEIEKETKQAQQTTDWVHFSQDAHRGHIRRRTEAERNPTISRQLLSRIVEELSGENHPCAREED